MKVSLAHLGEDFIRFGWVAALLFAAGFWHFPKGGIVPVGWAVHSTAFQLNVYEQKNKTTTKTTTTETNVKNYIQLFAGGWIGRCEHW